MAFIHIFCDLNDFIDIDGQINFTKVSVSIFVAKNAKLKFQLQF